MLPETTAVSHRRRDAKKSVNVSDFMCVVTKMQRAEDYSKRGIFTGLMAMLKSIGKEMNYE